MPVQPALGVGASDGRGYYAARYVFQTITSMALDQKAQYLEDGWQVNDRRMAKLGLRNGQFTNYNSATVKYVEQKDQWAPHRT